MDEVSVLKDKLEILKKKYKKKCEALAKANKKIPKRAWSDVDHAHKIAEFQESKILKSLTEHIDYNVYKVTYKYNNCIYVEEQVKSFGSKWIRQSLIIHLCRRSNAFPIHLPMIEIIKAEKLW